MEIAHTHFNALSIQIKQTFLRINFMNVVM